MLVGPCTPRLMVVTGMYDPLPVPLPLAPAKARPMGRSAVQILIFMTDHREYTGKDSKYVMAETTVRKCLEWQDGQVCCTYRYVV